MAGPLTPGFSIAGIPGVFVCTVYRTPCSVTVYTRRMNPRRDLLLILIVTATLLLVALAVHR